MRVALADADALVREGIVRMLERRRFEVVAAVGDPDALLRAVVRRKPDAVVMDVHLPPSFSDEGLRVAEVIDREMPDIALLILSAAVQPQLARRLLAERTRGRGYLLKERVTSPDVLCDAIRRLREGYCHIDPGVANYLAERQRAFAELSTREVEILSLMAQGRSNAGIGRDLSLAERTVETHVRNIMVKLGLEASPYDHRRVLAVVAYLARSG